MKKRIFKNILFALSVLLILSASGVGAYVFFAIQNLSEPEIHAVLEKQYSTIYDASGREIETLGENKKTYIPYDELPTVLIDALISIEDTEFFYHEGINPKRIFASLIHNIFSSSTQGGSTITQQLVKNLLLSSEHSLKRKIQEAYLAGLLEQSMTKEEILEYYFNEVYFEGSVPGIGYASRRFFNKEVKNLNLVEAATLAGLVKSPTYYSPYLHIENAEARKNVVLQAMYDNRKITLEELRLAQAKPVADCLVEKGAAYQEETYAYQAYLDIVYEEAQALTGFNPFSVPMEIETYLDTSVQKYLDEIQSGSVFPFSDDLQQIGAAVISNSDGALIGVIGGRKYEGLMLYNRAYEMKRQPASTMKPVFTYALAAEYLNFHEYTPVEDKPYTYPGTQTTVQNADKNYLGTLPLVDAIGYSRNTSTLYTLEKVIGKIGVDAAVSYLEKIHLMDEGTFAYPYAIGGMKYGISPVQLAGAYAMLARGGTYLLPSTIARIRSKDTGELLYSRDLIGERVLSEESSYIITSTLGKVMDGNYYNIAYARPYGMKVYAKTGTNAYDSSVISSYGFPSYADRDVWFAGYSKNYTIAAWSGFDEPVAGEKTYFGHNDQRRLIVKDIFRETMARLELKQQTFAMPETLKQVRIVKGIPGNYLPNELVPDAYIVTATFRADQIPTFTLPLPDLKAIRSLDILAVGNELHLTIHHELQDDELYKYLFGNKVFLITYSGEDFSQTQTVTTNTLVLPNYKKSFTLTVAETFANHTSLTGEPYVYEFTDAPSFWPI